MAKLELHRDIDLKGGRITVTSDVTNLKAEGFNDVVSSAKVFEGTFTLYEDKDFGGYSITLSTRGGPNNDGVYPDHASLGGRGDEFSSVRINDPLN